MFFTDFIQLLHGVR